MYKDMELEFLRVFVAESRELIEEVEPQLIDIHERAEQTGEVDVTAINSIFRLFHSMKGSAASLGLGNIASLTHKAETLLDLFRSGKASFMFEHVDLLMRALDLTRTYLDAVERTNSDKGREEDKQALEDELSASIQTATNAGSSATTKPDILPKEKKSASQKAPEKDADISKSVKTIPAKNAPPVAASAKSIDSSMQPLVDQFVEEALDILDKAEKTLLELEKSPEGSLQMVREIFRGIHSLKGNCGFLGFVELESLSHKAENVLEHFLENNTEPAPEHLMTFLIVVDSLRQGVSDLSAGGAGSIEGRSSVEDLLEQLRCAVEPDQDEPKKLGQILLEEGAVSEEQLSLALEKQRAALGEVLVDMGAADSETVEKALKKQSEQGANVTSISKSVKRTDIRVDLNKLDKLVNLVGELVIAETMVTRNPELKDLVLENFEKAVHHLRRVTSELQDVAMSVRMIPLAMTFQKLVRVVHDLARKEDKKVKLNLVGEETEVDKTMTEQIADPLLHMVRNSVDHGLEPPEDRIRLGKPEVGKVTIEARYEGGEVWIIVSDDGRGLDREKILKKAVEKGIVKGDSASLSDEEVFNLIFEPGFSTSNTVSEVSGRGVGMDVVKKNIERLKGRTSVRSKLGQGTSIYLHIPLTLAIIDGMLVRVGNASYTIPLLSIRESIRPTKNSITQTPDGEEIVRIREDLIPVIRLHRLHDKTPQYMELCDGILVIVEDQARKAAIFIDEILGQQQTVIKGLSQYLSNVKGVSGCTILGDGAVSLILDIGGLIEKAGGKAYQKHY